MFGKTYSPSFDETPYHTSMYIQVKYMGGCSKDKEEEEEKEVLDSWNFDYLLLIIHYTSIITNKGSLGKKVYATDLLTCDKLCLEVLPYQKS